MSSGLITRCPKIKVVEHPLTWENTVPGRVDTPIEQRSITPVHTSDLPGAKEDFRRSLRARGLAPRTVSKYLEAVTYLIDWCEKNGDQDVTGGLLQDYMADLQERKHYTSPSRKAPNNKPISKSYARNQYTGLQQFFKWAKAEQLVGDVWSMMSPPRVPPKPVPIIKTENIHKLLDSCKATEYAEAFYAARDAAMLRLLLDTGMRVSEIATLKVPNVDFAIDTVTVQGKGMKIRQIPFGNKSAQAMRRYWRLREKRTFAYCEEFFIGRQGTRTPQGVREMIERRCLAAGIPRIHPHQFRHTFCHTWLVEGLGETDLMRIMGWASRQMLEVYAASSASERALAAHRRAALGDRI